jgi:hypothetical protein
MWNTSLWNYKKGGFRQLINTISNKSVLVPHALSNFREVDQLPRKFKQMQVQDVSANPNLILELWSSRTNMPAEKEYKLGCKKAFREKQLIDSLVETYPIDTKLAKSKVVLGRYSDNERTFCYALEITIAPRTDVGRSHAGQIEIIDSVNNNASSDGGGSYFSGGSYRWEGRKRDYYGNRERLYASTIRSILAECGFVISGNYSKRRKPCVMFINLRCRCIEWLGAKGKTQINTDPFASDIAKTVSKLAYQMPSYHGEGNTGNSVYHDPLLTYRDPNQVARDWLREFLKDRYEKVTTDPSLKTRDRLTQSGVFYRIRRLMKNANPPFEPPTDWETTRRGLTGSIRDVCRELWGDRVTREDLGIVASARAIMLYDGQSYPVDVDSIKRLANKGIGIIIIEKSGIADVLAPFAEQYHIALVHTQGRFTEYGKELVEEIKEVGSIVWTLTDYDADGVDIAKETRTPTPRIGIDQSTIEWLQENGYDIEISDVEEEYTPRVEPEDEYLKTHRIELDSIVEKVGAEALWDYISYRIQLPELTPNKFNIGKVVTVPVADDNIFYWEKVNHFEIAYDTWKQKQLSIVKEYLRKLLEARRNELEDELENHELLKSKDKEEEIEEELKSIVYEDKSEKRQKIDAHFEKLLEPGILPELKPDDEIESNDSENLHVEFGNKINENKEGGYS